MLVLNVDDGDDANGGSPLASPTGTIQAHVSGLLQIPRPQINTVTALKP